MISRPRLISTGLILCALAVPARSNKDALEAFHAKYRSLSSIKMNFTSSDGLKGTITARRGGRYRIVVGDRTIVCNGSTVWNADAITHSVVINQYKPLSTDVSLERVFFEIMSVYRSQVVQSTAASTILRLEAPAPNAVIANVSSVDVTLDASLNVTKVSITSGPSRISYTITKFRSNASTSASLFQFSIPKGWEVIDLR
jgi:outer membrane lipoprotein-sorting protein